VVRLEVLSNLDCDLGELGALFDILDDPGRPPPVQQLAARAEALQEMVRIG
jgi:hypothetical protein